MVRRDIDNDKLNQPTELTTSNTDYPAPKTRHETFEEVRTKVHREKWEAKKKASDKKFKEDDAYYTQKLDNLINDTLSAANGVDDPKQLSEIFDMGDKEWRRICFQVKRSNKVIRLQPTAFVYNIYKLSQPKVEEKKIALSEEMPEALPAGEVEGAEKGKTALMKEEGFELEGGKIVPKKVLTEEGLKLKRELFDAEFPPSGIDEAEKEIIEGDMLNEFPKASKFLKDNHDKMADGMERYISGVDPINEDEKNPITTLPLPHADQDFEFKRLED